MIIIATKLTMHYNELFKFPSFHSLPSNHSSISQRRYDNFIGRLLFLLISNQVQILACLNLSGGCDTISSVGRHLLIEIRQKTVAHIFLYQWGITSLLLLHVFKRIQIATLPT